MSVLAAALSGRGNIRAAVDEAERTARSAMDRARQNARRGDRAATGRPSERLGSRPKPHRPKRLPSEEIGPAEEELQQESRVHAMRRLGNGPCSDSQACSHALFVATLCLLLLAAAAALRPSWSQAATRPQLSSSHLPLPPVNVPSSPPPCPQEPHQVKLTWPPPSMLPSPSPVAPPAPPSPESSPPPSPLPVSPPPNCLPPTAPPPPPVGKVDELNARFLAGRLDATSAYEAGIFIHQFDFMDASSPEGDVWVPGSGEMFDQEKGRCCKSTSDRGDRISATIINKQMQADPSGALPIFSFGLGGIILDPKRNRLLCGYPYDVGSLNRLCFPRGESARCVPGCTHPQRPNMPGAIVPPPRALAG